MENKKWILNMGISFAFNGTQKEAEEKLQDKSYKEEMDRDYGMQLEIDKLLKRK